jgi:Flp pilus assembly protein TadD
VLAGVWLAAPAAAQTPSDAFRACVRETGEAAVAACRAALVGPPDAEQSAPLSRALVTALARLERWTEVVDACRDWALRRPDDAEPRRRLGAALLHGLGRPSEAAAVFQEAAVLAPEEPEAHAGLGSALSVLGRYAEAVAAFDEAERLDPSFFQSQPAAREIREAARRGEAWPPG